MTLVSERIVVTAHEFLNKSNINDCKDYQEPIYQNKIKEFAWDFSFSAPSIVCEIIWKISLRGGGMAEWRQLERLFSPSPIATHSNFRGSQNFKTGNLPEIGSVVVWRRGIGWQGRIAIVTKVGEDRKTFDVVEGFALTGSIKNILSLKEIKNIPANNPYGREKLNILGFIYPPDREIT